MHRIWLFILAALALACSKDQFLETLVVSEIRIGNVVLNPDSLNHHVPVNEPVHITFTVALNASTFQEALSLTDVNGLRVEGITTLTNNQRTIHFQPLQVLKSYTSYTLTLHNTLRGASGELFKEKIIRFITKPGPLLVTALHINGTNVLPLNVIQQISRHPEIEIRFNEKINPSHLQSHWFRLIGPSGTVGLSLSVHADSLGVTLNPTNELMHLSRYQIWISSELTGKHGENFAGFIRNFYTEIDETPKFPLLSDEDLLTLVQQQTFRYFYDFAHPASGMARERNTSGDLVTTGGSGFGIMSLIVGVERGFITRTQCLERLNKILNFLETADRFHGAWPHWLNGNTGKVIPFSSNDNGGDLVETAFLIQGLIAIRQYLDESVPEELTLIDRINTLWLEVEWDWYRKGGENTLYWHWSPDNGWIMNMPIRGWNEALIVYVLAASSPTHGIPKVVYDNGWAMNGNMRNGNTFEGISLPLGPPYGGPLFFAHYSFLGLDPSRLADAYCSDYYLQNRHHALINYNYCVRNPKNFLGYSNRNWGLTASDNHAGYSAHSPTNDLGVISPTAAVASLPYTPEESMRALKFFYYTLGDRLWGPYGFYDAFNVTQGWTANSYLAIDQGPIVIMIENYRTGLLWNLFMSAPEIQSGLSALEFNF